MLLQSAVLGVLLLPGVTALPVRGADPPGPEMLVPGTAVATAPSEPDFSEEIVFSGLTEPTAVEFAANGHVFVAEKSGIIKEFDSLTDTSATTWADLRTKVHNFWDRGLLGMALHPDYPSTPKIYVGYTHDAAIGETAPEWGSVGGTSDGCPNPPGATGNGCLVSSRLSVLTKSSGSVTEQVLIEDWCQQFPSHSISDLVFGPDGRLYAAGGDGASFNYADYGQQNPTVDPDPDYPHNPCGDPPGGVGGTMELPEAEGGMLRSQDVRSTGDPLGLDGTVIRIDPATGAGVSGNPMFSNPSPNAKRIIAYGLRNPFRLTFRPGTQELWLGDVGMSAHEEVNRLSDTTPSSPVNFGWPCREGPVAGPLGLQTASLCTTLTSHQGPYFSYEHGEPVTDPDCDDGSSSIAGVAFADDDGNFPDSYDGALFLADYSRKCIWAMPAGSNGLPNPSAVFRFAQAANPVQLKIGPNGDLYYVDFQASGSVRRISYQAPIARISATPTSGDAPLFVQFDGSDSTAEHTPLSYAWDLDGDGQYDDSTAVAPSRTYSAAGTVRVRLRVTDAENQTDTDFVDIEVGENLAPVPVIASPSASLTWAVGDTITFSGSATDTEDGTLPASSLSWTLILQHCPASCHEHIIQTWPGVSGGSFSAPDHEYPSHLELRLTATDSGGKSTTVSRTLQPKTGTVWVASEPSGLQINIGSTTATSPASKTGIVGSAIGIGAPGPQVLDGVTYEFANWSHGGVASQNVVVTSGSKTYTAIYAAQFGDIASSPFAADIQWATAAGITFGCGGGNFCPLDPVTREQMASFLVRALSLTAGATPDRFNDIASSPHRGDINRLAAAEITTGCGNGAYCPLATVNREQMASFLVRALSLTAGATPDRFNDIAGSLHRLDINRLATAGITSGCGGGAYCPLSVVTREQMVAFLHRALTL